MLAAAFLKELKKLKNPQRAEWDQNYHKSQREHWGVGAPQSTSLIKLFTKQLQAHELHALAKELWATDQFDAMICAARILALPKVPPSPQLWTIIQSFLKKVDGWALEDTLAPAAWKCLLDDEKLLDELDAWTRHPNFWIRRAVLIFTLPFAKPHRNPERMLRWASSYASDPEWFMQKAIGWWLRILGQHNPQCVIQFLQEHWTQLKTVARKEATRKLPTDLLKNELKLRV